MPRALRNVLLGLLALVLLVGAFIGFTYATAEFHRDAPLPALKASTDPAVIEEGRYLVNAVAHCSACHGPGEAANKHELGPEGDLSGGYVMHAGPFGTYYPANLTPDPETGLGEVDDAHVARAIRYGVDRHGVLAPLMTLAVGTFADEDLVAVLSYLRSLPAKRRATEKDAFGFIAVMLNKAFQPHDEPAPKYVPRGGISVERGAYLANGPAVCVRCHTPLDPAQGFKPVGPAFSGASEADPDEFDPGTVNMPVNLTPDPKTGHTTGWSEDQFVARFKQGVLHRGSRMPWDNFKQLTEDDVRSVFRYLRTLPPTEHQVGPGHRPENWKPQG